VAQDKVQIPLYRQPGSQRFESESEARYFNCFHDGVSRLLGFCWDAKMWPGSFLRESESSWPIRKGVIALGALDLTSKVGLSQIRDGVKKENITENYIFALQQYNRFMKGMHQVLNAGDLRTKLLASIIVICFESYLGGAEAVSSQIRIGVRLIEQWKHKHARPGIHPLLSPAPNVIEDELIILFERLNITNRKESQGDALSEQEYLMGKEIIANMPKEFSSISEARMYETLLHIRTTQFLAAHDDKSSDALLIWDRIAGKLSLSTVLELKELKNDFDRWAQAFDPLFKDALTPGKSEFRAAAIQRAHYLVEVIVFEQGLHVDEVCFDYFHNEFVEMVGLAKALLVSEESNFTLSTHSVVVLDLVATKCRDPELRREAIRLLIDRPRREGFFDSVMVATICQWVVDIEEEGMVNGFIPEEARVRKIGAKFDLEKKNMELWCYQPREMGNLVDLKRRETKIKWLSPCKTIACYATY